MMSIPVQNYQGQMLVSESTRDLIKQNYQSTSKLEVQDNQNNILIRDDELEEQRKDSANFTSTDPHLDMIEEVKEEPEVQKVTRKKRRGDGASMPVRVAATE